MRERLRKRFPKRSPKDLGVRDGRLVPCPDSPNCVSSEGGPDRSRVDPLPLTTSVEHATRILRIALESMPRVTIAREEPGYLRAEFRSATLRFVDDLELRLDEKENLVHLRSASRTGHSDFGVNRRRVETLRKRYTEALATKP